MNDLIPIAERIAARLIAAHQTIAIAESSSGGLISAALLAVPGASAYYSGGAVVYTRVARKVLMDIPNDVMRPYRSSSEPYAQLLADRMRDRMATDWALSETGAAGPSGNVYGDAAGHSCFGVSGPFRGAMTLETASSDRVANMRAFAAGAMEFLLKKLPT